jgi:hypothetical protein
MTASINYKSIISGFFTFCVLTLIAFLFEMSLFYSRPFYTALGIHLAIIFARYGISTLIALIEIQRRLFLHAIVLCMVNLFFFSVLISTLGPNQYKEKATVIAIDLFVGLAACSLVAAYRGKKIKILQNNAIETDRD